MNLRQKLMRWAPVIFVFALIIVLAFIWYFTFSPSAWETTPNYLQIYLDFIVTRPLDAFLTVSSGPAESWGVYAWVSIPTYALIIIHIVLYMVGKQKKKQYTIVNKQYLIYLVVLGLFAISFQNASQYHGWYWNPQLNAPGYVDTWTHITSPWLLGALVAPLALERYFGWDRKFKWFFILAVLAITALGWEIGETLDVQTADPEEKYFNYPMDSLKDIIMGAGIATILSCWIYERFIMHFSEKAWVSE